MGMDERTGSPVWINIRISLTSSPLGHQESRCSSVNQAESFRLFHFFVQYTRAVYFLVKIMKGLCIMVTILK